MEIVALLTAVGVLPEPDVAALAAHARDDALAFPGCARLRGDVVQVNRMAAFRTEARLAFTATLADGTWSPPVTSGVTWSNQSVVISTRAGDHDYPFLLPFFGAHTGSVEDEGRAIFAEVLALLAVPVETEEVAPDVLDGREVYRYRRGLGTGWSLFRGRLENTLTVFVAPEALRARRWELEVEDPVKLGAGGGRLGRMSLTMETDADGWPLSEQVVARGGVGPLPFEVDRTIRYTRVGDCPP